LRLIFLRIFDGILLQEVKRTIFVGSQKKQFTNYGHFKQPKRCIMAVFGVKIKTQNSEHL
jgi:hypothetical protein